MLQSNFKLWCFRRDCWGLQGMQAASRGSKRRVLDCNPAGVAGKATPLFVVVAFVGMPLLQAWWREACTLHTCLLSC